MLKGTSQSVFSLLSSCLSLLCFHVLLLCRQEAALFGASLAFQATCCPRAPHHPAARTRTFTCCSLFLGISFNGTQSRVRGCGREVPGRCTGDGALPGPRHRKFQAPSLRGVPEFPAPVPCCCPSPRAGSGVVRAGCRGPSGATTPASWGPRPRAGPQVQQSFSSFLTMGWPKSSFGSFRNGTKNPNELFGQPKC